MLWYISQQPPKSNTNTQAHNPNTLSPVTKNKPTGESLLNDGSALVLFTLARGMVLSGTIPSGLEAVQTIARLSLIGPVIGLVLGALASYVRTYMYVCVPAVSMII